MNGGKTMRGRILRLAAALLSVLLLQARGLGGDVVRLKNGRTVEGKVVSLTPEVVTIQLEQGVLRIPRKQVVSIQMERKPLVLPSPPPAEGAAGVKLRPPREPEPGEEGWKPPTVKPGKPEGKKKEGPKGKNSVPVPVKKSGEPAPKGKTGVPGKDRPSPPSAGGKPGPTGGDEVVDYLLKRYVWLIPNSTGNRISLGVGILFVLTLASYISARLADIEDITLSRAFVFTVAALLVFLGEAALSWHASWPILAGLGTLDLFLWFAGVRVFLGEGSWKGFLMLSFFSFGLLVLVLWLEVGGYILSL